LPFPLLLFLFPLLLLLHLLLLPLEPAAAKCSEQLLAWWNAQKLFRQVGEEGYGAMEFGVRWRGWIQ
jgi:hypothetical protein